MQAAEKAIANPLLDEISLHGAKGVLINITGGYDLTLFELDEAANIIREKVDPDANIIVGSTLDTSMEGALRVSVVATGIDVEPEPGRNAGRAPVDGSAADRRCTAPAAVEPRPMPCRVPRRAGRAAPRARAEPVRGPQLEAATVRRASSSCWTTTMLPTTCRRPAYRPQQPQPRRSSRRLSLDDDAGGFVAPRPRAAGTPSPEALARLQAAVSKAPGAAAARPAAAPQPQPRAAAPAAEAADKPRFGIGSLINRMAGHAEAAAERAAPGPRAAAAGDRPMTTSQELSADQERIEIPAFLRRQAN